MAAHEDLAMAIGDASDNGHKKKLIELTEECLKRLEGATDTERVRLHYFNANCHAGINAINRHDSEFKVAQSKTLSLGPLRR